MTLTEFGLAYTKCTFMDLKRFIRDRGIETIIRDRKQMIRDLRRADREAVFPFFDLIPELRNMVYGAVLKIEQEHNDATISPIREKPTIPMTCKQTYQEASWVLYGNCTFLLIVRFGAADAPNLCDIYLNGVCIYRTCAVLGDLERIPGVKWPALLTRIEHLSLRVELGSKQVQQMHQIAVAGGILLNNVLHRLTRALVERCSLRSMQTVISSHLTLETRFMQEVLSPLSLLAARVGEGAYEFCNVPAAVRIEIQGATLGFGRMLANEIHMRDAVSRLQQSE